VVAVPLGRRRRRVRGFNQAEVIAEALAGEVGVSASPGLVRVRETAAQVGADEALRRDNVSGAFVWRGEPLAGSAVWLVDDVLTTGATTAAAAMALRAAGAGPIEITVVALVL
jgi:predicted amidophosphoribosyltransferase